MRAKKKQNQSGVIVLNNSAIFDRKVSTAFELHLVHVFKLRGVLLFCSILFYRFGICMLYCAYFVKVGQFFFYKIPNSCTNANSPNFENVLLGKDL